MNEAGSITLFIGVLLTLALLVLGTLRHYLKLRSTPLFLLVPIFLALFLPLSIVLLVPVDLTSTHSSEQRDSGLWLPHKALLVLWRGAYWTVFALTWIVLPILGEYVDSGYRTPRDRFLYSLRSNGRYQLILVLCATAASIYVFLVNGFRHGSIVSLIVALAYCWGLSLAIYLLGHGLVTLPRRCFRNADTLSCLRSLQSQAPSTSERLADAKTDLEDVEAQILALCRRKNALSPHHAAWVECLAAGIEDRQHPEVHVPPVLSNQFLASLSRRLNRARHKCLRFSLALDSLLAQVTWTEAILQSRETYRLALGPSFLLRSPYQRYLLFTCILPWLQRAAGVGMALASVCIVWSEVCKHILPRLSIISLTIVSHPFDPQTVQVHFWGEIVSALWLCYMCMATISSFPDVKIWGNRALVPGETYHESATWYAAQVAKLTVPLAYNFQTFLPRALHTKTTFYSLLGFDYFFPIFILLPVSATLFDLYGRVRRVIGPSFMMEDVSSDTQWQEGRDLIANIRRQQQPTHESLRARLRTSNPRRVELQQEDNVLEADDESAFASFTHRVQNTIDGLERPTWIQELVNKRPKWMQNDGTSLGRWFGRPAEGHVRL